VYTVSRHTIRCENFQLRHCRPFNLFSLFRPPPPLSLPPSFSLFVRRSFSRPFVAAGYGSFCHRWPPFLRSFVLSPQPLSPVTSSRYLRANKRTRGFARVGSGRAARTLGGGGGRQSRLITHLVGPGPRDKHCRSNYYF